MMTRRMLLSLKESAETLSIGQSAAHDKTARAILNLNRQ
jgi:hypothetical protein